LEHHKHHGDDAACSCYPIERLVRIEDESAVRPGSQYFENDYDEEYDVYDDVDENEEKRFPELEEGFRGNCILLGPLPTERGQGRGMHKTSAYRH
jgi:adenine specific DNA methylase Mod